MWRTLGIIHFSIPSYVPDYRQAYSRVATIGAKLSVEKKVSSWHQSSERFFLGGIHANCSQHVQTTCWPLPEPSHSLATNGCNWPRPAARHLPTDLKSVTSFRGALAAAISGRDHSPISGGDVRSFEWRPPRFGGGGAIPSPALLEERRAAVDEEARTPHGPAAGNLAHRWGRKWRAIARWICVPGAIGIVLEKRL